MTKHKDKKPQIPEANLQLAAILWQRGVCPRCQGRLPASKNVPVKWVGTELVHRECA